MNEMMLRQVGLFVGIFFRLIAPAIYVWYNTPSFKWDHKYTKQAVLAGVIAFGAVIMGYTAPEPNLTPYQVFWYGIKDGVLLEEAINQVRKWDDLRIDKMLGERTDE